MKFQVSIFTPMYEHNNKKYMLCVINMRSYVLKNDKYYYHRKVIKNKKADLSNTNSES